MGDIELISIEVAYAEPDRQVVLACQVPRGCPVAEAVRLSGIQSLFPQIDLEKNALGIFGKTVPPDTPVEVNDRVEIYRPLKADPQTRRRRAAGRGGTVDRPERE